VWLSLDYAARCAAALVVEKEVIMLALVLALFVGNGVGSNGFASPPQRYDLIEVNSVYAVNDNGVILAYTQVLFRNWSPDYRRYHTHAWMIPKSLDEFPVKVGNKWVSKFRFGSLYHAEAKLYKETETFGDPERHERRFLFDEKLRDCPLRGRP
jgi:hypothetical protein